MKCKVCGGQLVYGKRDEKKGIWCPSCEGFKVLSKSESKQILREEIRALNEWCVNRIKKFDDDQLIGSLLATRDGGLLKTLKEDVFDPSYFISISLLIKEVVKKNPISSMNKEVNHKSEEYQKLIEKYNYLTILRKFFTYIDLNYVRFVNMPPKDIPRFTIDYEKNIKYNLAPKYDKSEDVKSILKFTPKWMPILENCRKFGLASSIEVEDQIRKNKESEDISDVKRFVGTILSFKLATPDMDLLRYPDLEDKRKLIDVLYKLYKENSNKLKENEYRDHRNFDVEVKSMPFSKLYKQIKAYGINFDEFENHFIFDQIEVENNKVPLIYESIKNNGYVVPPLSLLIMFKYFEFRYKLDIGTINSKYGKAFEEEISNEIKNVGLKIGAPNDPSEDLCNIKDNEKKPTLEIDILAYDNSTIYVIDCKHFLLSYDFLSGNRENKIRNKLKGIDKKQRKRIKYIRENLKQYGFDKNKDWEFKSVIITLLIEPVNSIGNTYLISKWNLQNIYDIPSVNYNFK